MATATLITVPVYQINSQQIINRTLYPYGMPVIFAGATLNVQPNTTTGGIQELQAGGQAGAALIYSRVRSAATGDTIFFSSLTPAAIATLANA